MDFWIGLDDCCFLFSYSAIGSGKANEGKLRVSIFFSSLANDLNSIERSVCYK